MSNWQSAPAMRYEAHYGDRVARCFANRPMGVDQILRDTVALRPDAEALVDNGRRFTYAEFDRMVDAVAAGLIARGVQPGDRIALLLGNRAEFAFALFGAMRAGAAIVPLNTREQMPEIAFNVQDSGAKVLFFESTLADRIPDAATVPTLTHKIAVGESVAGAEAFDALTSPAAPVSTPEFGQEAVAVILYTSGTTGKPKGAMLTQMSMVMSALHYEFCLGMTDRDRALMAVPATHVTGLVAILLTMVKSGGVTIFQTVFKAADFLALAAEERMTYTLMVPAMYNLCLLQASFDDYDLSGWRAGGYGGSPMPIATVRKLAEKLPNLQLFNCYGSTETTSPSTITPLGEAEARIDTVGQPVPCCDIKIVDDDGIEVPRGDSGEIWIAGGHVGAGYWNNPVATAANFTAGYWHSGDIGCMTDDGFIKVLDRKKDMINRAGYKVYSAEVEDVLAHHPQIGEAAVVAEPDPVLGEKTHAFVLVKEGKLTADDIKLFCRERLSDYKVPDFVTFVDQPLPRNANGKILKRALRNA
ncbi:MAG TPA: class I adenylate-forming enzyme family protein [Alphaproteobacteria bacterium]|nr:class I adenylate-forming enzyme family protein [Alphaproteobacteria bacterium]